MQIELIKKLNLSELYLFAIDGKSQIEFKASDLTKIQSRRKKLLSACKKKTFYGVNTGFGILSDVTIEHSKLEQLQYNLIRSHSAGIGKVVDEKIVRTMLLLRILNLFKPESCASDEIINQSINCFNKGILPIVPDIGSLGASGDLAPLAHLAAIFTGDGEGHYFGKSQKVFPLKTIIKTPIKLGPKDGLTFINGVQGILSIALHNLHHAKNLLSIANLVAAASLDGFHGTLKPFDERLFISRPHPGMQAVAKHIRELLKNSPMNKEHVDCKKVQDPYSFRCIPQVHGSFHHILNHVEEVCGFDAVAATDNPLIYENGKDLDVISGGNFHGMPLAHAMDYLAIGITSFSAMAERRIEKLINPFLGDLPAFLTKDPGLNSGMMIVHYTSAGIVNKMKTLSHPHSVDSIPTNVDKEDHVSMGWNAAIKTKEILELAKLLIGIEAVVACQALEFRRPTKSSESVEWLYKKIRKIVPAMMTDHFVGTDMKNIQENFDQIIEENPWKLFG